MSLFLKIGARVIRGKGFGDDSIPISLMEIDGRVKRWRGISPQGYSRREAKGTWLRGEAMKMNASFSFVDLRIVIGMRNFCERWRGPRAVPASQLEVQMSKCMTRRMQKFRLGAGSLLLALAAQPAVAQGAATSPFMDTNLTPEQRAADLVHRMTLEEKATQMQNNSAAVPRLKVPAYQWWSEALHGVINEGVTEYPEPVGLAATFDAPGIHTMAAQIGIEGRIKHVQNAREGHTGIMGGLDFWSPKSEHLPRSAMGPRAGDLWRRSVPDGPHGRCLCDRIAGRRSEVLPRPSRRQSTMRCTADRSRRATSPMWT